MSEPEILLNGRPLESYRVVDLKQELEKRGLSKSGAKKDLISRLAKNMRQEMSRNEESAATTLPQVNIDEGLAGNDFVKDYLALRETQFQQAMGSPTKEEVKESEPEPVAQISPIKADPVKLPEKIEVIPQQPEPQSKEAPQPEPQEKEEVPQSESKEITKTVEHESKVEESSQPKLSDDGDKQKTQEEPEKPNVEKTQAPKSPVKSPKKSAKIEEEEKVAVEKDENSTTKEEEEESVLEIEPKDSDLIDTKTNSPDVEKIDSETAEEANVSFRKLGKPVIQRHKRQWSSNKSKSSEQEEVGTISSADLKDLIPDIKPILNESSEDKMEEEVEEEKPEVPDAPVEKEDGKEENIPEVEKEKNGQEPPQEKIVQGEPMEEVSVKRPEMLNTVNIMEEEPEEDIDDDSVSEFIHVTNLVRPFTLNQLKELLNRTGNIVEDFFTINKIKSQCIVKYSSKKEAKETKSVLDGVRWPNSNPKNLKVEFSSESEFNKLNENSDVRKRPHESEPQRDDKKPRLDTSNGGKHSSSSNSKDKKKPPPKPLDDLFRRTKATPCIYWQMA